MTAPARTLADEFPVRDVRFVNGRTTHRTRQPDGDRWWDLLEAACGRTGYLAGGYSGGVVTGCRGCGRVVDDSKTEGGRAA